MQNFAYQLLHPWHWLTYGQNAAGLGLIGLFFYTLFTWRMMKNVEATRRADITPEFSLRSLPKIEPSVFEYTPASQIGLIPPKPTGYSVVMTVRNIGEGPAIGLQSWHQPVSTRFNIDNSSVLTRPSGASEGSQETAELSKATELLKDESMTVVFHGYSYGHVPWLFIVESTDLVNGKNQLKILMSGPNETTVRMVHALGDSLGERIVGAANRFVEIISAVKQTLGKLSK